MGEGIDSIPYHETSDESVKAAVERGYLHDQGQGNCIGTAKNTQRQCGETLGKIPEKPREVTNAEANAKRAQHHFDEAKKALAASEFLATNPAFDEFISLVRRGIINFY